MPMIRTHCVKLQKKYIGERHSRKILWHRNVHESFDCPQSLLETLGSA